MTKMKSETDHKINLCNAKHALQYMIDIINFGGHRIQFSEQKVEEFFKRYYQGSPNQINETRQMISTEIHRRVEERDLLSINGTHLSLSEEIQLEEYLRADEFRNSVSGKVYDYYLEFLLAQ